MAGTPTNSWGDFWARLNPFSGFHAENNDPGSQIKDIINYLDVPPANRTDFTNRLGSKDLPPDALTGFHNSLKTSYDANGGKPLTGGTRAKALADATDTAKQTGDTYIPAGDSGFVTTIPDPNAGKTEKIIADAVKTAGAPAGNAAHRPRDDKIADPPKPGTAKAGTKHSFSAADNAASPSGEDWLHIKNLPPLKEAHFAFDKFELTEEDKKALTGNLDIIKPILQKHPDLKMTIIGHTDTVGTDGYNERLSMRRALAVQNFYAAHGIDAAQMQTQGASYHDLEKKTGPQTNEAANRSATTAFENPPQEKPRPAGTAPQATAQQPTKVYALPPSPPPPCPPPQAVVVQSLYNPAGVPLYVGSAAGGWWFAQHHGHRGNFSQLGPNFIGAGFGTGTAAGMRIGSGGIGIAGGVSGGAGLSGGSFLGRPFFGRGGFLGGGGHHH